MEELIERLIREKVQLEQQLETVTNLASRIAAYGIDGDYTIDADLEVDDVKIIVDDRGIHVIAR